MFRSGLTRFRQRGRAAVSRAARLTGAAVAAYVMADLLLHGAVPVTAALTALLVVEVTPLGILTSGLQRVISVLAGVLLAIGFSSLVAISWWSLGILVAASIMVGQLLRLGPHLLEVPISAMLVLAVGGQGTVATDRIVETLIGAVVGVAVNLVFPPRIRADSAASAVGKFADEIAALLETAARELRDGITTDEATRWLEDARRLSRHVARIDRALQQAVESRRLNPRALAQVNPTHHLQAGLDALEHSSVAVRSMFRSVLDGIRGDDRTGGDIADAVRDAFATMLSELATAVHAYGNLIRAEVAETVEPAQDAAVLALHALRDAQARVIELRLVDHHEDHVMWELNEALLQAVDRILVELQVQPHATAARPLDLALNTLKPRTLLKAAQQYLPSELHRPVDKRE